MAVRVLSGLAVICAIAAVALFLLQAFSTVIAVALAAVFALGALIAKGVQRAAAPPV